MILTELLLCPVGSLKQVYDGVFNSNTTTISKLQWVLEGAWLHIQVGAPASPGVVGDNNEAAARSMTEVEDETAEM